MLNYRMIANVAMGPLDGRVSVLHSCTSLDTDVSYDYICELRRLPLEGREPYTSKNGPGIAFIMDDLRSHGLESALGLTMDVSYPWHLVLYST